MPYPCIEETVIWTYLHKYICCKLRKLSDRINRHIANFGQRHKCDPVSLFFGWLCLCWVGSNKLQATVSTLPQRSPDSTHCFYSCFWEDFSNAPFQCFNVHMIRTLIILNKHNKRQKRLFHRKSEISAFRFNGIAGISTFYWFITIWTLQMNWPDIQLAICVQWQNCGLQIQRIIAD